MSEKQGIYSSSKGKEKNGRKYWEQKDGNQAIWYSEYYNDWLIGNIDQLGTIYSDVSSWTDLSTPCPYNEKNNKWKYKINYTWIETIDGAIKFKCIDEGMLSKLHFVTIENHF